MVTKWCSELEQLPLVAESQPHAAYSAYVHGYQHKFRYFLRTLHDIKEELRPLNEVISNQLFPLSFGSQVSETNQELISLPVRLGGMGIESISSVADEEYSRSKQIAAPLAAIIALEGNSLPEPARGSLREEKRSPRTT